MKISLIIMPMVVLLLSACNEHNPTPGAGELNAGASLPAALNFNTTGLKVICSTINKRSGTMSTLYGNDDAKAGAQAGNGQYITGSVFALVTWKQQPDKRWIGGNIPGRLLLLEMLKAGQNSSYALPIYSRFKGADLKRDQDTTGKDSRTKFILGLKPSIMF